ncbi:MAG: hypothetical protein IJC52_02370 [Clostridia bacterium]|nr:hypothetical protein [Clostridia bacterium]
MIEIKNAAVERAMIYAERYGVADMVLEMIERGEVLGVACLTLCEGETTLVHLHAPDAPLTDALLRAALNAARAKGAKTAYSTCENVTRHMLAKGYISDFEHPFLEIAEFFSKSACKT